MSNARGVQVFAALARLVASPHSPPLTGHNEAASLSEDVDSSVDFEVPQLSERRTRR